MKKEAFFAGAAVFAAILNGCAVNMVLPQEKAGGDLQKKEPIYLQIESESESDQEFFRDLLIRQSVERTKVG